MILSLNSPNVAVPTAKYIRMSPSKIQRVLNQIRGKSYKESLMILEFMPYAACKPVLQAVQSAGANAQHNKGINKNDLVVSLASVDNGPVLRRFRPRAQGRGFKIQKFTSHIRIGVQKQVNF
ncbi:ribosomal protein L22 (chloroplast) [Guillardia theta]|uniref:Large ribosomal subunit protein uL22c n=2 Tax=Guillardia theta TaxID=55529 RepID=RK22_GUITH|nr:ribosomal protein L22 [Guillardia theta]O46899.1 RecName: Full=Large ribosomal subunit protein uL22c; AltName: Full=50S ribosomal protein L22, chloroplastic [Guillardia theta]AAC35708.1 ribosomal protein L22 [Guillardia theta]